jgi:cyanophycinase
MTASVKPIYLLADSQLLFWADGDRPFIRAIRDLIEEDQPKAAYVGASNGDDPAYYSIFEAAMDLAGVHDRRMIHGDYSPADDAYLRSAHIILLAGGDAALGWRTMEAAGMTPVLLDRYSEGAVLIGVSAGAVLLGRAGWSGVDPDRAARSDALNLVPWTIHAHDEAEHWTRLKGVLSRPGLSSRGLGLPRGGGLICHANLTLEAIRWPVPEFLAVGADVIQTLLLPPRGDTLMA